MIPASVRTPLKVVAANPPACHMLLPTAAHVGDEGRGSMQRRGKGACKGREGGRLHVRVEGEGCIIIKGEEHPDTDSCRRLNASIGNTTDGLHRADVDLCSGARSTESQLPCERMTGDAPA